MTWSKEDIQLVMDIDEWAQESNARVDKQFSRLYSYAANTAEGWSSVATSSPEVFKQAFELATKWRHNKISMV